MEWADKMRRGLRIDRDNTGNQIILFTVFNIMISDKKFEH